MKQTIDRKALFAPYEAAKEIQDTAQKALVEAEKALAEASVDTGGDPLEIVTRQENAARLVAVRKIELGRAQQAAEDAYGPIWNRVREMLEPLADLLKERAEQRKAEIMVGLREFAGSDEAFGMLKLSHRLEFFPNQCIGVYDLKAAAETLERMSQSMPNDLGLVLDQIDKCNALIG